MRHHNINGNRNADRQTRRARVLRRAAIPVVAAVLTGGIANASPYASNVTITGTTVNFVLNENADSLSYTINGGAAVPLIGAKGPQTFNLGAPTDTFKIFASNQATGGGYNVPSGVVTVTQASGLGRDTMGGTLRQTSDDTNPNNVFNSPRGVSVSTDPSAPNFGTAYVSNSAPGTKIDGLYSISPDQSASTGAFDGILGAAVTSNTPYKITVAKNGEIYVSAFGDALSGLWRSDPGMTTLTNVLDGTNGVPPIAPQNHGSTLSVYATGSSATNNLELWTIDEDLTSSYVFGSGATDDINSIWHYTIGNNATPFTAMPDQRINSGIINISGVLGDFNRGADGKFFVSQNRSVGTEFGMRVLSSDASTVLVDSLAASRAISGDLAANDIIRNIFGMSISPDQKYIMGVCNNNDLVVIPLINGIPDIANRLVVDQVSNTASARDIAVDAAGNIHYVSSGNAIYRVFAEGGAQASVYSWNGSAASFNSSVGTLYWDLNGATANTGNATPTGTWDGSGTKFNTDPTGAATIGFLASNATQGDEVVFAAGTDGSGTYTVNVSGTQTARMITIPRGNVTLANGVLNVGEFNVAATATGTVTSDLAGGPNGNLTKGGPGLLTVNGAVPYTGATSVLEGSLVINSTSSSGNFYVLTGATATLNGVTNGGSATGIVKGGGGLLKLNGTNSYTGTTAVAGGTVAFGTPHVTGSGVDVRNGALIQLAHSAVTPNNVVLKTPSITLNTTGKIDVTNNKIIVPAGDPGTWDGVSSYTGITGMVQAGRGSSNLWNGTTGILTSEPSAQGSNYTSIGVARASDIRPSTATATSTWGGQTITGSDVLVMYTYGGDATLDGKINIDDYVRIDSGISAGLTGWFNGDFNYDGKVSIDDYITVIDANISTQGANIPSGGGIDGGGSGVSAVPEPASLALLGLGAFGLLGSRRRRAR